MAITKILYIENELNCSSFLAISRIHWICSYTASGCIVVSKCQKIHMWFHLNRKINEILMTITMTTTMHRAPNSKNREWNEIVSARETVRGTSKQQMNKRNERMNMSAIHRNPASERRCGVAIRKQPNAEMKISSHFIYSIRTYQHKYQKFGGNNSFFKITHSFVSYIELCKFT